MQPSLSAPYLSWLFFAFKGRLPRLPAWAGALFLTALTSAAEWLLSDVAGERIIAFVGLLLIYPSAAIYKKRMNDRDMEPKWLWLFLAPDLTVTFLMAAGLVKHGEVASPAVSFVLLALFVIFVAMVIELGLKRGTQGPNPHGPDPL